MLKKFYYWVHKKFSKPEEGGVYSSGYWQDNRILIMDAGGIGDLVMATPVLRAIRERFKKSYITLLAVPRAAEVVKDLPYFDELIEFDIDNRLESLRSLWRLRRRRFDMMIDLQAIESWPASLRRMFLYLIINPRIKVGQNTDHRGFFLDIFLLTFQIFYVIIKNKMEGFHRKPTRKGKVAHSSFCTQLVQKNQQRFGYMPGASKGTCGLPVTGSDGKSPLSPLGKGEV